MDIQVILGGIYTAMWILSIIENLKVRDGTGETTHPPAKDRLMRMKGKLQEVMRTNLCVLEVYDKLFSVLWKRFSVIAKDVEAKALAGRPIAEVTYKQIKNIIYNEAKIR